MFFAKNSDSSNLRMYLTLLNQLVNENKEDYKPLFDEIITCSHQLAEGSISHYAIRYDLYEIVKFLSETNKAYFERLDPNKINSDTYKSIQTIFVSMLSAKDNETATYA